MNPVFEAADELQRFLAQRQWRFCIIGGLAVARWGEPRATRDVDITLFAGFGDEEPFVEQLLAHFQARVPDPAAFALAHRVVLLLASNGTPVDLALGGLPFEERVVGRATPFEFAPGLFLTTCSAEDLVVLKAFADRPRDWADLDGVVVRQGDQLDWPYIVAQLEPLCQLKEAPEILTRLDEVRRAAEGQ